MATVPAGTLVPAKELLNVALAACSIQHFSRVKRFVEPRWTLGTGTPLTVALLATAITAARWKEQKRSNVVDGLHLAMRGGKNEDFMAVAKRLMRVLEDFDTTLFRVTETVSGAVKCYEMSDEKTCRRIIWHASEAFGPDIALFADDAARTFQSMRVFISQFDEALRTWCDARG